MNSNYRKLWTILWKNLSRTILVISLLLLTSQSSWGGTQWEWPNQFWVFTAGKRNWIYPICNLPKFWIVETAMAKYVLRTEIPIRIAWSLWLKLCFWCWSQALSSKVWPNIEKRRVLNKFYFSELLAQHSITSTMRSWQS